MTHPARLQLNAIHAMLGVGYNDCVGSRSARPAAANHSPA